MTHVATLPLRKGIEIQNFGVHIDGQQRLRVDRMGIREKGVTAVLGPSGCGKSTLLRVLSGIHGPSIKHTGEIVENGEKRTENIGLRYAMVWQTPTVFPCNVYDNLKVPLRKKGVPTSEWTDAMEAVLERTGLANELGAGWAKVSASKLSGGQRQRLCIAMGLLMDSQVLLLDEPTSALDPTATEKVEQIIVDLGTERSVILVTHSIGQAKRVSELAAIFCSRDGCGYLCENGPSAQVLYEPEAEASRRFLRMEMG